MNRSATGLRKGVRRMVGEPLVHFSVLGILLFLTFELSGSDSSGQETILVTRSKINGMAEVWSRTWQRPPTEAELDGLVDDYIREEVLSREAKAMGLDRDDTIIRRRLRQKIEFLSEDLAALRAATEEDLGMFLEEQRDRFLVPPRYSFRHLYLNPDRRGNQSEADAESLLETLRSSAQARPDLLGDPYPLPLEYNEMTGKEVARLFGERFAAELKGLPLRSWSGPVVSGYGLHLVHIEKVTPAHLPALEEIRGDVEREWSFQQRESASEAFYLALREKYEVVVESSDSN